MDVGRVAQREYFLEIPNLAYFCFMLKKIELKTLKVL